MLTIEDADLPGLAELGPEQLCRITRADEVALLRLRYRPGKRAILHVATRAGTAWQEGTIWFLGGDKGRRAARRNKDHARFDPETRALFEPFPQDHRMPQIRAFLDRHAAILPELTGFAAAGAPVLVRYRPGLSCSFRCALAGQPPAFVKLIRDDDPVRLRDANRAMQRALAGTGLSVAPVLGIAPDLGAIAYGCAPGTPLDQALAAQGTPDPVDRAIAGLGQFWTAPLHPSRRMDRDVLLTRARESAEFVALMYPAFQPELAAILDRLGAASPGAALVPVHGDMKLEHLFLDADRATLIDTESVASGYADYDLAQLFGHILLAELDGRLPGPLARAAGARVLAHAGPAFDWCLGVIAVRLAKFHAQRPGPGAAAAVRALLDRLT